MNENNGYESERKEKKT